MDDYYEYKGRDLRLSIWETNKGPELGYVKWRIERRDDVLGWYAVSRTSNPLTFDDALAQGRRSLNDTPRTPYTGPAPHARLPSDERGDEEGGE